YTLRKQQSPALTPAEFGHIDAVLLSHDHHADNLDHAGREFLSTASAIYTTQAGAARLAGHARGLAPWESRTWSTDEHPPVKVTATPARHGPDGGDRGPCIGFVLQADGQSRVVYVSGDTVWFDGVE